MVKAAVVSLQEIPWFIYCSESENFEGDTWVTQCEVLQATIFGATPADEDMPPDDPNDLNPGLFDFVGFGQPGQAPFHGPLAGHDDAPQANDWGLWPQHLPGQNNVVGNVEVPVQIGVGEPFLELNDLLQDNAVADFDLNEPLDHDLGDVEDIIPEHNEDMIVDDHPEPVQEDIIDASSQSSASANSDPAPVLDLNEPVHVEVFIPMENGHPLQLIPDEVPEEDLMSSDEEINQEEEQGLHLAEHNQEHEHMRLGFVEVQQPSVDPVLGNLLECPVLKSSQLPPELYRLWAANFAGPSSSVVTISPDWASFFTAALMNPGSFEWAKKFLSSPAWNFIANPGPVTSAFPSQGNALCSSHRLACNQLETMPPS